MLTDYTTAPDPYMVARFAEENTLTSKDTTQKNMKDLTCLFFFVWLRQL
jgi:hypothetical protein